MPSEFPNNTFSIISSKLYDGDDDVSTYGWGSGMKYFNGIQRIWIKRWFIINIISWFNFYDLMM